MKTLKGGRVQFRPDKVRDADLVQIGPPPGLAEDLKDQAEAVLAQGRRRQRRADRSKFVQDLWGALLVQWAFHDCLATWFDHAPPANAAMTILGRPFMVRSSWRSDKPRFYVNGRDREPVNCYLFGYCQADGQEIHLVGYCTDADLDNYGRAHQREDYKSYSVPSREVRTIAELVECIRARSNTFHGRRW